MSVSVCDEPNAAAIAAFTEAVFGITDGFVAVRLIREKGTEDGPPASCYFPADETLADRLLQQARTAARDRRGLYVVPGTVARPDRAKAEDITQMAAVVVDIDSGDIAAKVDYLAEHLGTPSLEVASGGVTEDGQPKRHVYWCLAERVECDEVRALCAMRGEIARKIGGDLAFRSPHQPIRVPGSLHGKNGVLAPVRLVGRSDQRYKFADLVTAVNRMPGKSARHTGASKHAPTAVDLMTRATREGGIDEVTRFEAACKVTGHWIRLMGLGRITRSAAWNAVREWNSACLNPPLAEPRLERIFNGLLQRDAIANAWPADVRGTTGEASPPPLSEDALADAFALRAQPDFRHVGIWGRWMLWTGARWESDEINTVREAIRQVCREAAVRADTPARACRIASERTIRSVEKIAAGDPRFVVSTSAWDTDPMLLNTPGGIVDLRTGRVSPSRREAMMTQITGASAGSTCPRWLEFLDEIAAGDRELVGFLARLFGYCATGDTSEQVFGFFYGHGSNGKSLLLQTVSAVLGSYAATAPFETFAGTRLDRHPTDLAGLRGARLVTVTETERGRSWSESRIKTVTGGDPIRVRFMGQDFFEFRPNFKLIVAGNHRPAFHGVGEAMRRRLNVVPFTVTFTEKQRDRGLAERLLVEADGILTWIISGCLEWQRMGLAPPATVRCAADEYFADEDSVGQWIAETCETRSGLRSTARELFESWSIWARDNGIDPGSQKILGESLRGRELTPGKVGGSRGWIGITLRR